MIWLRAWWRWLVLAAAAIAGAILIVLGRRQAGERIAAKAAIGKLVGDLARAEVTQAQAVETYRALAHAKGEVQEKLAAVSERAKSLGGMSDDEVEAELARRGYR